MAMSRLPTVGGCSMASKPSFVSGSVSDPVLESGTSRIMNAVPFSALTLRLLLNQSGALAMAYPRLFSFSQSLKECPVFPHPKQMRVVLAALLAPVANLAWHGNMPACQVHETQVHAGVRCLDLFLGLLSRRRVCGLQLLRP